MSDTVISAYWSFKHFTSANGVNLPYQIYIPSTYTPEKKYPCILYMHSAGVKCSDGSQIKTPEAKFLRVLEEGKYADDVIVIAPCCPSGESWVRPRNKALLFDFLSVMPEPYMAATLELFESCMTDLSIDRDRLYTYGMSMGAHAVWDLISRNPGVFAAAVPAAGAGDPSAVHLMDKTSIWIFHGALDDIVPCECGKIMKRALEDIGRSDVKYTEFPTLSHGIWSATALTEGLLDWMFSKTLKNS